MVLSLIPALSSAASAAATPASVRMPAARTGSELVANAERRAKLVRTSLNLCTFGQANVVEAVHAQVRVALFLP
ncbi:hypothetical protein [Cupriavidus basilensis]|uniref:Uncharacterized protein n=1 Tax=Cupriavidus basilensis TaxID=68895 RepID=A0A643G2Y5_9BURK|nr:hypothetical protein [Cupriavidus basilensis]QOT78236.1 hypothetical protein F7R26_009620 [Cupriavidus basilensis]